MIIAILWLACSVFNIYGFSRIFSNLPVTLLDVVMCTVFAPIMFFVVLGGLGNKIVIFERRKK